MFNTQASREQQQLYETTTTVAETTSKAPK